MSSFTMSLKQGPKSNSWCRGQRREAQARWAVLHQHSFTYDSALLSVLPQTWHQRCEFSLLLLLWFHQNLRWEARESRRKVLPPAPSVTGAQQRIQTREIPTYCKMTKFLELTAEIDVNDFICSKPWSFKTSRNPLTTPWWWQDLQKRH